MTDVAGSRLTDAEVIAAFFTELDRRIRGTSGDLPPHRREKLRLLRPRLRLQAEENPEGFARRLHELGSLPPRNSQPEEAT